MNKHLLILFFILFLGFSLRFYRLGQSPARLTHDEMSIGYNAYSILKTGKDEWGRALPLDFEAFGDHKLPAYIYATIPFISIFGLNSISIKIVSLISGLFLVLLIYLLASNLTKNKEIGLIAAFLTAINPWPVHLSRMALESNLALILLISGIYLLIKAENKGKNKLRYILSAVLIAVSWYSYISYRIISGLLVFGIFAYSIIIKKKIANQFKLWLFVFVIVLLPLFNSLFGVSGLARAKQVSIFTNPGIEMTINEKRSFCYLSGGKYFANICKFFFHKPAEYYKQFATNYLNYLSPSFLFLEGDKLSYLANPGYGEFFSILTPFYIMGFYLLLNLKSFGASLIKMLFFIAPIPSALTGPPQIVRGSALMPVVIIMIAFGIYAFINKFNKCRLAIKVSLLSLVIFSGMQYYLDYYFIYPAAFDNAAYPIDQRVSDYVKKANFSEVFVESDFSDAYILFAFYNQIDPLYLQQNIIRNKPDSFGFSHPYKLGQMTFLHNPEEQIRELVCERKDQNYVFILKPNNKLPATVTLYNFSGVHPQVSIFETLKMREYFQKIDKLESYCQNNNFI